MDKEAVLVSPMFDDLGVWLMEQGLRETSVEDLVQGFGRRLTAAGVAVQRVNLGGLMLHPIFGALNVAWESRNDTVVSNMVPRTGLISEEFRDAPFFRAATKQIAFERDAQAVHDVDFPNSGSAGWFRLGQLL